MSKLSELCEGIYVEYGQFAVHDFITTNYPRQPWAWCEPCEIKSPRDSDYACLVCGSPTEPYWGQDKGETE